MDPSIKLKIFYMNFNKDLEADNEFSKNIQTNPIQTFEGKYEEEKIIKVGSSEICDIIIKD